MVSGVMCSTDLHLTQRHGATEKKQKICFLCASVSLRQSFFGSISLPVQYHRHLSRRSRLCRGVHQETLSVPRHIVAVQLRPGPHEHARIEQALRSGNPEVRAGSHGGHQQVPISIDKEELLPIPAPARLRSAFRGNRPSTAAYWKLLHVYVAAPVLIRDVRYEFSIG